MITPRIKICQIKRAERYIVKFGLMMKHKYNLIDYCDTTKPTLFFGLSKQVNYETLKNHKGKAMVLWCGSDGLRLKKYFHKYKNALLKAEHIVMSDFLMKDLNAVGLKAKKIPIIPTSPCINPEPRGENIYIYTSKSKKNNFYGIQHVEEIKKRTNLNVIVATKNTYKQKELLNVYKSCFIGLRLTPHDGLPNTVVEMGLMGRRCIYNGDTPNAIKWNKIDDICESILLEYKNRNKNDIQQIHNEISEYINVGTDWLFIN